MLVVIVSVSVQFNSGFMLEVLVFSKAVENH